MLSYRGRVAATVLLFGVFLSSESVCRAGDDPVWVYNAWSAYDELSDHVPLDEALVMRELGEARRLKGLGVRFDYYMMDAFWFQPDGGYRTWRKESWPNGPDAWIRAATAAGMKPGMWFSTNSLTCGLQLAPQWKDSLSGNLWTMSFSDGGFLADFMSVLQLWYDRGIRVFEFDFADFDAATPRQAQTLSKDEIHRRNVQAFRDALAAFKAKNADVKLLAYNGFGGDLETTLGPLPFKDPVDPAWLGFMDVMYTGDPRFADVPTVPIWRSEDIYADHQTIRYAANGIPFLGQDATEFMNGDTGTNYARGMSAWQGDLILTAARGGRLNTIHGDLALFDTPRAQWLAKVQRMYFPLRKSGVAKAFGGIPGQAEPYGFASAASQGGLYAVVNPLQAVSTLQMPDVVDGGHPNSGGRVLFRDAGFEPVLSGDSITLGPGQMALVGYGEYSKADYDLGIQDDVVIPFQIQPVEPQSVTPPSHDGQGTSVTLSILPPADGDMRIIMQQRWGDSSGDVFRTWGKDANMGTVFTIQAVQGGESVAVKIDYDKVIWSGLSWAAGEIPRSELVPGIPLTVKLTTVEKNAAIDARVYRVDYGR